jgi:hypothetical protein
MKKLLGFLFAIIVFSACSKVDPVKDLPAGDGKWNLAITSTITTNGVQTNATSAAGTITFANAMATMVLTGIGSSTEPYVATENNVTIGTTGDVTTYTITEKTKTSQTWTSSGTETNGGITTKIDEIFKLTK